jgi:hypothetical protein
MRQYAGVMLLSLPHLYLGQVDGSVFTDRGDLRGRPDILQSQNFLPVQSN